jgi:HNH endonuclease
VNPLYHRVAERAGNRCEYCRAPEQVFNFAFEVEHILPRAAGRDDSLENLALACESCNLYKSDATTGWDDLEARDVLLFHPRRDHWEDHFRFDGETGQVRGRTATGRGTVARLRMNSAFQLRARRQWTRLGLYP